MACAIEDAGWEIRDSIHWLYGQGQPKSLNLGDGRGTALAIVQIDVAFTCTLVGGLS
jgi:site-specific DNA-methyltransferase (adenine-specific)